MNLFLGYVLAQIVCHGELNCHAEPVSDKIYTSLSECEWDLEALKRMYPDSACVEALRNENPVKF